MPEEEHQAFLKYMKNRKAIPRKKTQPKPSASDDPDDEVIPY